MKLQTKTKKPTQKQLAIAFGVSDRTIRNWDRRRMLRLPPRGLGRRSKTKDPILGKLLRHYTAQLKKGVISTQQEIADHVFQETGQKISQATISRILKKRKLTRKKASYHYNEQLNYSEKIEKFIEEVPTLSKFPILALDECSFHLNEVPRYAYATRGMRANRRKPSKKGDNHTLILCILNQGRHSIVHWELIPGGMKTKDFHNFLTNLKLPSNEKHYLLMDNLKVHKATSSCKKLKLSTIRELLVSKNIEPIYLPPYSPQLNPVELCFNFLRNNTEKRKPRTTEELKSSVSKAIEALEKQDLTKYFKHCWEYFDKDEEWEKDIEKRTKKSNHANWLYKQVFKLKIPWWDQPILPSRKWKKLGTNPTPQKLLSSWRRIKSCVVRSLELASLK